MYVYNAQVERVVDGDTIRATVDLGFDTWKKVTIRLNGINTPESRTKDLEEKARGLAAKARLKEILKNNGNKFVLVSSGVDKYGRCLGKIYLEEGDIYNNTDQRWVILSVNQQLINEGHAVEYHGGAR